MCPDKLGGVVEPCIRPVDDKSIWSMVQHFIWAFLKASGILSCRAAAATLPRSVSEERAAVMKVEQGKDRGSKKAWVEEREKGGTKCQCDGGLKNTFTGEKCCITKTCVPAAANSLTQQQSPSCLMTFRCSPYIRSLLHSFCSRSVSSPWLCEMSLCFLPPTIWQWFDSLHTKIYCIHSTLGRFECRAVMFGDTFTLSCTSFGASIMSTQTKHQGLHNLFCEAG